MKTTPKPKNPYHFPKLPPNRRRRHGFVALWEHLCGHLARQVKRLPRPARRKPRNRRRKCGFFLCPWRRRAAAALKHLPWVKVCYDAFHLVSNMNEVVDKVRRAEFAHPTESLRKLVAGQRYHLLQAKENLDEDASKELEKLLEANKPLSTTYMLKEQFRAIFIQGSENASIWELSRWIRLAMKSGVSQVKKFAHGIADKFNEVINGIRYKINSGRIKSANAGIKRIQSKCCGLFDIEYLFMKMRQIFLSKHDSYFQRI